MNGMETIRIPKFLEGETLPPGYFDPINPYVSAPKCNLNIRKLANYMEANGKTQWDLTKEEVKMFENK